MKPEGQLHACFNTVNIDSTLERGARLVLDDLEDLLELLHLVVLGKDLRRIRGGAYLGLVRFGFRVGAMARARFRFRSG